MIRLALAGVVVLAACGTDDNREFESAQYIDQAILAPACGAAQCHSTFAQKGPPGGNPPQAYVFDTLIGMRHSIMNYGLVQLDSGTFDPADVTNAGLITWITQIDPLGLGIGRMPYDAPLPDADVDLIKKWITGPVTSTDEHAVCSAITACPRQGDICQYADPNPPAGAVGECFFNEYPNPAAGAQCNPSSPMWCKNTTLYTCTPDWNFGTVVQICDNDCFNQVGQGGACSP